MSDPMQDVETKIEAKRSGLERALGQLLTALSPEQVSGRIADEVKSRSGVVSRSAVDMAKANPAGAILLGAGLAAMLAGPKRPERAPAYDTRHGATAPGLSDSDPLTGEFDRRVAAATASKDQPSASKLRAAINSGLGNLPEPARRRVVQAREAAIDAQEKIDRQVEVATRKARSFHHRQPLAAGALALGAGALVAALLPRTRIEDDLVGAQRDTLLQQAELTLRDELAKATATGEAALRDGMQAGIDRVQNG